MAGNDCNKISSLIAREFSFVQELVWSPPHKNPFPRCTDKIVSDFRKLEVLFRRPAASSLRPSRSCSNVKRCQRVAERGLAILEGNGDRLIKLRRFFCKELLSLQNSPCLGEFEHNAESLIMQELDTAWPCHKHMSVEAWASKLKELNFQALYTALQRLFSSLFDYDVDYARDAGNRDYSHDPKPTFQEVRQCFLSNKASESISDVKSSNDNGESDADVASEVDSIEVVPQNNEGLPLIVVTNNGVKHEGEFRISNIKSRGKLPIQIEMTMKARICVEHIPTSEYYCWHIIFGIINHDHRKIAVDSLNYWSLDNVSEVSTIKWPEGGVVLKEAPSLLSYACRMYCTGPPDSPRVAYNWQYRALRKDTTILRGVSNALMKGRMADHLSCGLLDESTGVRTKESSEDSWCVTNSNHFLGAANYNVSGEQTVREGRNDSFYRRLSNLLPWKDSCKKAKLSRC
ncbi:hypothetical protein KP509_22G050900 [Ceratopteris richardii]|uniref:Uncharacterized protein n=1 Tax=Ceratopteris richardii TaxID=49495 RepID=A0A8T2S6Z1_CERRI|nr:hypothetical protein KP509_22G050900 [Ceratopteris richardii]